MQPNEWSGDVRSPGRSRRQCAAHWCSRGPRPEPPEEDGRGWPWMAMGLAVGTKTLEISGEPGIEQL